MPIITSNDFAECAICQESKISDNGLIWQLETPCGHDFHQDCLRELLRHNPNSPCPLCRVTISDTDKAGIARDTQSPSPVRGGGYSGMPTSPGVERGFSQQADYQQRRFSNSRHRRPSTPRLVSPQIRTVSPSDRHRPSHSYSYSPNQHQHSFSNPPTCNSYPYIPRFHHHHHPSSTNTWHQTLQAARHIAYANHISTLQSPQIALRFAQLYRDLEDQNPRGGRGGGHEPSLEELVRAFQTILMDRSGELEVGEFLLEWDPVAERECANCRDRGRCRDTRRPSMYQTTHHHHHHYQANTTSYSPDRQNRNTSPIAQRAHRPRPTRRHSERSDRSEISSIADLEITLALKLSLETEAEEEDVRRAVEESLR